ncbi:MAG: prolyl oligopeptidase family serine peptidase [Luteitalea sp.]|nr:prolyl oligopeptidase family serine peptidase [Luteitalea sp.]
MSAQEPKLLPYPDTKSVDVNDDYFGTKVPDPYRWLEDDNSAETKAWVEAQNKVTFAYLEGIPEREGIRKRLTELWDYERYGAPAKHGPWYIFSHNTGLQNQSVIFRTQRLSAEPEVLIDPNALSPDGTVALGDLSFTDDGRLVVYALQSSGSDWREWHVRDVAAGKDLPDVIKWSKFVGAAWLKDSSGFFYGGYTEPTAGETLTAVNKNQKLYFHKLGTSQDQDQLIYERPDQPDWMFSADVTEDGRWLLIYQSEGTDPRNRIFVRDLSQSDSKIEPLLDKFDASYTVVGNDGERFYVLTDNGAPRRRLVAIEKTAPDASSWETLIPEASNRDVLDGVTMVNDQFVAIWMTDAYNTLRIYGRDGRAEAEVPLPAMGSVSTFTGKRKDREGFFAFESFTHPTTTFRYDFATKRSEVFKEPEVAFNPADYETTQVFYPSKDGTKIPMFITSRKGTPRHGQTPTLMHGYGGFEVSLTPSFAVASLAWLERGGILAVPNLRGGGEYGKEWHDAGRLENKQNVFDDFIAAAEYLIREKYTSSSKLAISGGSNGGLLVGACMTQRPDLFGAALPAVGVMDMLRFDKFTVGWAWRSDYGSSETKEGFDTLVKYSPLHNIEPGTAYPATLITTADHDDRVVPAHSFKFAATLQAAQAGKAPVLIRIETEAGHGAGKPTSKLIDEATDRFAFLAQVLRDGAQSSSQ